MAPSDGSHLALALDIGATKLGAALVAVDGSVEGWTTIPTEVHKGPEDVLRRLLSLADGLVGRATAEVAAVGVACGGPMDAEEGILWGPLHLPGWDRIPIIDLIVSRFAWPSVLVNDASAGAWAEYCCGAAVGSKSMIYMTVSSGIGGGAVIDGTLLRGAHGNGGEFGHVLWEREGRLCRCGRRGCVEAYAAGTQMAERAREALQAGRRSALTGAADITAELIASLRSSDALCAELWEVGMAALGSAVTDAVNLLEPDRVIIGGGLTGSGDALFEPVRSQVTENAVRRPGGPPAIVPAQLGAAVCAVGAGLLAHEAAGADRRTVLRSHV